MNPLLPSPEGGQFTSFGTSAPSPRVIWLASYPRSGNTWLRFLLAGYVFGPARYWHDIGRLSLELECWQRTEPADGDVSERLLQRAGQAQSSFRRIEGFPGHLFFKSHFELTERHPFLAHTERAVHLIRNPKDVLLSGANFAALLAADHELSPTLEQQYAETFVEHGGDPVWRDAGYGTWRSHAESWLGTRRFPVLGVRYEELKRAPERELTRILQFLGAKVEPLRVAKAVRSASLSRLQRVERVTRARRPLCALKNPARRFFHCGLSNQSLHHLGGSLDARFDQAFAEARESLGYSGTSLVERTT